MSLPSPGWQDDVPAEPKHSGGLGLPHPQESNYQEKAELGFSLHVADAWGTRNLQGLGKC